MTDRPRARSSTFAIALTGLVVAGFVLRLWGNRFGLPFLYHEDEGEIVRRALRMPADGPSPGWFQYPTLYVYVQAAAYALLWMASRITGSAASYAAFAEAARLDPTPVYALGRTITAACGAATIAAVGLAGRRFSSLEPRARDIAGFVAASLVCVELLQVEHAHFITADVPMTLASMLALLGIAKIAGSPDDATPKSYAIAGALVGIAASIKYPGALFSVAVVAVYVQCTTWRTRADIGARLRDIRLPLAAAASVVAFVMASPFVILDWQTFLRDLAEEAAHMRSGHLGFEIVQNHWAEVFANLVESGDAVLLGLAVIGAVTVIRMRDRFGRALVVTLLVLLLFAASSNVLFARYLIPMLPVAALLGAHALAAAVQACAPRRRALRAAIVPVGLCLALALPAWLVAHRLALFAAADTRTLAWTWVNERLRERGDRIAVEWKSIPTRPSFDVADASPVVYDIERLRADGVAYVAISDRLYRRFLRAPDHYPQQAAFYRELIARADLVAMFTPFDDRHGQLVVGEGEVPIVQRTKTWAPWSDLTRRERSGPVIHVYRLR